MVNRILLGKIWRKSISRHNLVVGGAFVGITIFLLWMLCPLLAGWDLEAGRKHSEILRNYLLALAVPGGAFGLYLAWLRSKALQKQAEVAQEAHFTDLFTKAIEQLGNDDQSVQIGGIYGLERIARDSPKDHGAIMEILCAFVREKAKNPPPLDDKNSETMRQENSCQPPPKMSVVVALRVLGRRKHENDPENFHLDLRDTWLKKWEILEGEGNFAKAIFNQCRLDDTVLDGANFEGAWFLDAYLPNSKIRCANLRQAVFIKSVLNRSNLSGSDLYGADLTGAYLNDACLDGSGNLTQDQINSAKSTQHAELPPDLVSPKVPEPEF